MALTVEPGAMVSGTAMPTMIALATARREAMAATLKSILKIVGWVVLLKYKNKELLKSVYKSIVVIVVVDVSVDDEKGR